MIPCSLDPNKLSFHSKTVESIKWSCRRAAEVLSENEDAIRKVD